ncbi:MAG: biotin--[Flexilinea sp.]|nr:biotin--[acetyl-CoA-carboxylase] ligase [Flexilinea sp.]
METGSCEQKERDLKQALSGLPIGDVHYFDTIGSTNDHGFACAEAGAPDMTVITAFEQTAGRGRMHRKWVTVPGTSLPMTVIIRPKSDEIDHLNLFSPLTGLAVREALAAGWGIESEIKWPNDVLLNRKKICGILCEILWEGDRLKSLILGLGTNLLHGAAPEVPDLTYPASSVEDETGTVISRPDWIRHFLEQLIRLRPLIGKPEFYALWENNLAYRDETVTLVRPDGTAERGTVRGIDADGNLIIENQSGQIRTYLAGEISLRPV